MPGMSLSVCICFSWRPRRPAAADVAIFADVRCEMALSEEGSSTVVGGLYVDGEKRSSDRNELNIPTNRGEEETHASAHKNDASPISKKRMKRVGYRTTNTG